VNLQLLVAVVAAVITIYFALLVIGFLFKLIFIAAALGVTVWAWRAWRTSREGLT
jgi:hypothetical protein